MPFEGYLFALFITFSDIAQVAELVDALASGASGRKVVEVQVLSWAPFILICSRGLRPNS